MAHLVYRLPLVALLLASTAAAQPQPSERKLKQRALTLPASAGEATVHVARGVLTTLTFDSNLVARGVVLQGRETHFERVDEDERLVSFKPKVDLAPGERLVLTVRFADGTDATLDLVAASEEVDASVEVVRRTRNAEALQAELSQTQARLFALQARCGEGSPIELILAGLLDPYVNATWFDAAVPPGNASGLKVESGVGYRTSTWGVVTVRVRNLPGRRVWVPAAARLATARGVSIQVKAVRMNKPQLGPGEEGVVLVETGAPDWEDDEELRLELSDKAGGRHLPISRVRL